MVANSLKLGNFRQPRVVGFAQLGDIFPRAGAAGEVLGVGGTSLAVGGGGWFICAPVVSGRGPSRPREPKGRSGPRRPLPSRARRRPIPRKRRRRNSPE